MYRYWGPRTTVYSSDARHLPIFLKAVDSDVRSGIRVAIGVASAADMAKRIDEARSQLNDFQSLSMGRFPGFRFVEATNLQTLIK
jgi:hypothetical protein